MLNIETFDINDSLCKSYSIQFSSLIEFVKKLRTLTKTAKFHIIKLLNLKINKLKSKSKVKDADSSNKLKNKQDEVDFLEKADLDTLSKRIFANRYTINDLEKSGDRLSLEDRIVIRLFSFNRIYKEIIDFRSQHSDWEELVDVVLYKNTCGKIKVHKKTSSKNVVSIPLAYGIEEINVAKDESKKIFVTPQSVVREDKREKKKESATKRSSNEKNEIQSKKSNEGKMEKNKSVVKETFDVSDENIREFIKNEDDLDDWERDDNGIGEGEIDLMAPLILSGDVNEKSQPIKKVKTGNKQKKSIKRKFPFESKPKIWKKSV